MQNRVKKLTLLILAVFLSTCDRDRFPTEPDEGSPGQIAIVLEDEPSQVELTSNRIDSSKISLQKEKAQQQPQLSAVNQLDVRVLKQDNSQLTSRSFNASEGRFRGTIEIKAQNDLKVLCIGKNNGVVERFGIDTDVDVIAGRTTTASISGWSAGYIPRITSINPNPSTDGSYTVSWSKVTGATGYVLQEAANTGFTGARTINPGNNTYASITGKSPGTYYYRVQAKNEYNVTSGWSSSQSVVVSISAPTLTDPGTGVLSGENYTLTWSSVSGATSYTIEEATDNSFTGAVSQTVSGTSLSFNHSVTSATSYYYRVKANINTFSSDWSNIVDMIVNPPAITTNIVKVTDASGSEGSDVTVRVLATSNKNIVGADFEVVFDAAKLQIKEAIAGSGATEMTLMELDVTGANTSGKLRVSMVDFTLTNPIAAGWDRGILTITFTISAGASGDIPITLSNLELSDESANNIPASPVNGTITVIP